MKTKHGKCGECQLCMSKKFSETSFVSSNNNVNELDIYVVCDFEKNGKDLIEFFKKDFPEFKYGIGDKYLCDDTGFTNINKNECINNCALNAVVISKRCKSPRNYILGIKYKENLSQYGFKYVETIDDLKKDLCNEKSEEEKQNEIKKYYSFQIPEKYYTDEYRLVDVQYIQVINKLIYIFRDKQNNKSFYEFPSYDKDFYWYESVKSNKIIEEIDKLRLVTGRYKDRNRTKLAYGGDINICTQHSVDYFLNNKQEAPIVRQNIMFFDIETYQYLDGTFPNPDQAKYPITAISFRSDDPKDYVHVFLLKIKGEIDPKVDDLLKSGDYPYITLFDDEAVMLKSFFARVKKANIDFLAGWNVSGFDVPYIVKRMKNLNIHDKELSPYGFIYADKSGRNQIAGYVVMDQLKLFKELTYITQPSYSLNAIAGVVLGKEKVQHVGKSIDEMYHEDMKLFMDYSQQDTQLIYEIEQAERHIALQDEIRRVATVSHEGANSTIGQAEGLYATSMKKKGLIARNYTHDVQKESFPGAYVFDARGGLHEGLLCDFDFTSLYPSIINTWNIGPDTFIAMVSPDIAWEYIFAKNNLKNKKFEVLLDPIHNTKSVEMSLDQFEKIMIKYQGQITIAGTVFCGHDIYEGINYTVVSMLMKSRKIYKKKMLEAKEAKQEQLTMEYNGKQLAFKILNNSLYGVLGNEHFRFYNPNLGKSITLTGQEMLKYCAVHMDQYMAGKQSETSFTIDPKYASKIEQLKCIIYGDTDSVFVYLTDFLKNKGIKVEKSQLVLDEVSKVQKFTNEIAIPTLLKRHNINLKRSIMNLKNEFLFSRYYALNGKKHYAAKVISQEGKDISYIDIKGLEIKRSEIPARSQKMLSDMIDTIMDEKVKKWELKSKLDAILTEARNDMNRLIEEHRPEVARVVAFSKDISEYKTMPQHVKAMLMWNTLIGKEDFKTGSKGKLWNVLGIELNKAPEDVQKNYYEVFQKKFAASDLKCIAIPEDVEILPDYFIVDQKKMIEYACEDRATNLLEPMWTETDDDVLF